MASKQEDGVQFPLLVASVTLLSRWVIASHDQLFYIEATRSCFTLAQISNISTPSTSLCPFFRQAFPSFYSLQTALYLPTGKMIDPLTAVNLATEGLSICIKVISILKRYASAVKNVKQELVDLLKRVEHMRNLFGLLRSLSLTLELHKTQQSLMQLEIDKKEYEQTMEDLLSLASEVVAKKTFFAGLYWGTKKNAAVRLTEKLRHQEEQIINVVTIIGT